jgi:hypothetical protein
MKTLLETEIGWSLVKIAMGLLLGGILMCALTSCGPDRRIMHTPSKREIRKAMSYSTWEYNNVRPTSTAISVSVDQDKVTH